VLTIFVFFFFAAWLGVDWTRAWYKVV
jgi:hypothetical protein